MRDIKSFAKEKKKTEGKTAYEKDTLQYGDELRKTVEELSEKNTDELLSELLKTVEEKKKDGSFSGSELRAFIAAVSPMLNSEQQKKLLQFADIIK